MDDCEQGCKKRCVCVSPQMERLDAEHKTFTFRVVSVCVSSLAFFAFFSGATFQVGNQRKVLLWYQACHLLVASKCGTDKKGLLLLLLSASQRRISVWRSGWEFWPWGGRWHENQEAALCLPDFILWFEWESSISFPPGPVAETSREPPSWWSDRWSVQSIVLTRALRKFALACKYKMQPCWVPKWDVK